MAEVHRLHSDVPASVTFDENVPLEEVIAVVASNPAIRGIFVVDSQEKFIGVISRSDLMKWIHLMLFGGKARRELTIREIFRLVFASKAKDLLRSEMHTIGVKEDDRLQTALDKIVHHEQDILPVLDKDGKIIGDLTLNKVLLALRSNQQFNTTMAC